MVIIMSIKIKAEDIIAIAKEKGERFEHKDVIEIGDEEDLENGDYEYCKYDIDLLGVPLDAKFIIHQYGDKPDLKITAIGNTIDGDIIMFVEDKE